MGGRKKKDAKDAMDHDAQHSTQNTDLGDDEFLRNADAVLGNDNPLVKHKSADGMTTGIKKMMWMSVSRHSRLKHV